MGQLSKELDVPLSTATRIVNGLVDNGLAERTDDPEDRRVVRVILTETGRSLHQIMNEFMRERIDQILGRFTAEEREQFIFLLLKVAKIMDEIVT
jgi:DNA-binding MarR family transcriptional regulator